jgi:hypothetical protein
MDSARGRIDHAIALVHKNMREPGFDPQPGELFGESLKLDPHQLECINDNELTAYAKQQFESQRLAKRWTDVRVTSRRFIGTTDMWLDFECRWK